MSKINGDTRESPGRTLTIKIDGQWFEMTKCEIGKLIEDSIQILVNDSPVTFL